MGNLASDIYISEELYPIEIRESQEEHAREAFSYYWVVATYETFCGNII